MDKVRFGRALGYGARHMAKAALKAADAASTPAPISSSSPQPAPAQRVQPVERVSQARQTVANSALQAKVVGTQAKALGRSVWSPLAKFSGTLWLQVTGSIYAVIALAMGQAVWLRRSDLHLSSHTTAAQRAYLLLGIFLLFTYFAASSFIRAARREKL